MAPYWVFLSPLLGTFGPLTTSIELVIPFHQIIFQIKLHAFDPSLLSMKIFEFLRCAGYLG